MASSFQAALTRAKRRRGHAPAAPAGPPLGTYDPAYDAQGRNIQRSYDDLLQNFGISKTRAQDDLSLALGNLGTSQQNALSDLATGQSRGLSDIALQGKYAGENRDLATQGLDRRYGSLAQTQAEGARRGNVESGGILAQSLAKRVANRAYDQQPVDTAFNREQTALGTAQDRLQQDYGTNVERTNQGASLKSDALKLAFDRAFGPSGDNVLNLSRAGRDLNSGLLDLNSSKWYAAAANGYAPIPAHRRRKAVIV